MLTIFLNIGAAVEPPVTYSDLGLTEAPHKITEPTTGPLDVSIKPVKDVLYLKSEYPTPSMWVLLVPVLPPII